MSQTITVRDTIHSGHRLPGHRGECRFVHGSSWQGIITITCERFPVDERGVSLDPDRLRGLLRRFDHRMIVASDDQVLLDPTRVDPESVVVIEGRAPTAENVAATLVQDAARYIEATFPDRAMPYTIAVSVAESDDDVFSMARATVI